jgi:HD domain-containing protein
VQLADVPTPSTPAAALAAEVVRRFSPPALVNHCHRAYVLAAALALQDGLDVDWELLYVASLLHDIALEPAFDNHSLPFEDAGGHVAWVFAAGAGWTVERRDHAAAVIVAHMRGTDPAVDPEGHLLDLATGLDISGRNVERWSEPLLVELLDAYPRLDLAERFTACFLDQAARKPESSAADAVGSGVAERLANNPLDDLAGQGRYR